MKGVAILVRAGAEALGGYLRRLPGHLGRGARGWLDFGGRSPREEFATLWALNWVVQTYNTAFLLSLTQGLTALPEGSGERGLLLMGSALFLWGNTAAIASGVRRFRDGGLSPWWGLALAVPIANLVALPLALFRRSRQG